MAGTGGSNTQTFASTLTDLMTSLAVIFVLLLVVFLKQAHDQGRKTKDQVKEQLTELLQQKSLQLKQDAEDPLKLAVRVGEEQLRFALGSAALSPVGAGFLTGFFKNFAHEVCNTALKNKIDSIVIEGHTDTSGEKTPEGVKQNIVLSQRRSLSVLDQALKSVQGTPETYECLLKLASASGRGSRTPIVVDDVYRPELSRRVEIKIRVKSAEQQFNASDAPPASAPPTESEQRSLQ